MAGNEAFLRPDVYTFEEEVGGQPFQPAGTSAAGFVDVATWGPVGEARLITSLSQYYRTYGSEFSMGHMTRAVKNFFRLGGRRCYIVRTAHYTNITDEDSHTAETADFTVTTPPEYVLDLGTSDSGTFRLGYGTRFTSDIDHDANASAIQAALVSVYGTGNVSVALQSGETNVFDITLLGPTLEADFSDLSYPGEADADLTAGETDDLFEIKGRYPGTRGNALQFSVVNVDAVEGKFDLVILDNGKYLERYVGVTLNESDEVDFIEYRVNANPDAQWFGSNWITVYHVYDGLETNPSPNSYLPTNLTGGTNGTGDPGAPMTTMVADDYVGDAAAYNGVYAYDKIDEMVGICHPGNTSTQVIIGGLNYVYNHPYTKPPRTNLYVYDLPLGLEPLDALHYVRDDIMMTTGYEAVYYPWVKVGDRYEPTAPYMLGCFAQNDLYRGVWQAPAGVNFPLPVTGLAYEVTLGDQEVLNPHGINCIVKQDYWGVVPWGARTLRVHTKFRYINVRRFVNLIKKTLYNGGKQFVFELNAPKTWARVQESAEMLMAFFYSLGAFAGRTRDESYYCKCDRDTNPPELVEQGILTCEVGICPVKPAEFVVFNVLLYNEGVLPLGDAMSLID